MPITKKKPEGSTKTAAPSSRKKKEKGSSAAFTEILFDAAPNPYHPPQPPYVWIDYPEENESLNASEYVIRLGVGGADAVEISLNGEIWQPCRFAGGYWWFDWKDIPVGKHQLSARMKTSEGSWYRTPLRTCRKN